MSRYEDNLIQMNISQLRDVLRFKKGQLRQAKKNGWGDIWIVELSETIEQVKGLIYFLRRRK